MQDSGPRFSVITGVHGNLSEPAIEVRPETLPQKRQKMVAKPRAIVAHIRVCRVVENRRAGRRVRKSQSEPTIHIGTSEWE
jgi:hypothetical protein